MNHFSQFEFKKSLVVDSFAHCTHKEFDATFVLFWNSWMSKRKFRIPDKKLDSLSGK